MASRRCLFSALVLAVIFALFFVYPVSADRCPTCNIPPSELPDPTANAAETHAVEELVGLNPPPDWWKTARSVPPPARADLPAAFDWRNYGAIPPVRNQGSCGSCWAFGTVGIMESALRIFRGINVDLSEQYLVSCNTNGWSCGGGWWAHNYHISPGAMLESDFPYVGWDAPCISGPHPYRIDDWAYVGGEYPTVQAIKQAIYTYGPVAVGVRVGPAFGSYSGGIFTTHEAGPVNHAVILVGWDDNQGPNGVWILRNSWGSGWGEGGYMRIAYGTSSVGYAANYVIFYDIEPPQVGALIPDSGWSKPGVLQSFTTEYVGRDIRYADMMINSNANSGSNCVYVRYDVKFNRLYLRDNSDSKWLGGACPGADVVIGNKYGKLLAKKTQVTYAGDTLTITWAIKFKAAFSPGNYNIYLRAESQTGENTGWEDKGDWTVNYTPQPTYLYPASSQSRAGTSKVFTTRYADKDGWQHLEDVFLLITDTLPAGSPVGPMVYMRYDPQANRFYLRDDSGSAWLPEEGIVPGLNDPANVVENSTCILLGSKCSVSVYDASTLQVKWCAQFKAAFKGDHGVYLEAVDDMSTGLRGDSGWERKGSCKVIAPE